MFVLEEGYEHEIITIVGDWMTQRQEGTLIFSSSFLLDYWEEKILSTFGFIGGIRLGLFAGIVESVAQVRSEQREITLEDQLFLLWGVCQSLSDKSDNDSYSAWKQTNIGQSLAGMIRELKQAGSPTVELLKSSGFPDPFTEIYNGYENSLKSLGLCDHENAFFEACRSLEEQGTPSYLKRLIIVGFQELTAQQSRFLSVLKDAEIRNIGMAPLVDDDGLDISTIQSLNVDIQGFIGVDREWEIRGIAGEIDRLLKTGISAETIAVVFRNIQIYRPFIKQLFNEYGIPWNEPISVRWDQIPSLTSLLLWLRIVKTNSQPSRSEMVYLFNLYFTEEFGLAVDRWIADDPVIARKNLTLSEWAGWLEKQASSAEPLLASKARKLAQYAASPRENMSLSDLWSFGRVWLTEWEENEDALQEDDITPGEWKIRCVLLSKAREELLETWNRWENWTLQLGWNEQVFSIRQFAALLEELLAETETADAVNEFSKVTVATPTQIKNSSFETIFIGGLVEGEFPKRPTRPFLMNAEMFHALSNAGFALKSPEEFLLNERRTIKQILISSQKSIYLSFSQTEVDGRLLAPSPFVLEIQAALPGNSTLWPVISPSGRFNQSPLGLVDEFNLLSGPPSTETFQCIQSEWHRRQGRPIFSGQLGDQPEIVHCLSMEFSSRYSFSPSALKEFASCPFGFYCHRVLRVQPVEVPSPLSTPAELGSLYHEILLIFFNRRPEQRLIHSETDDYFQEISEIADELAGHWLNPAGEGNDPYILHRLQLAALKESLRHFILDEIHWQEKIDGRYLPYKFEQNFGAVDDPLQIIIGSDKEPMIRLSGKIDRIDRSSDGQSFIIFDYKTGGVPKSTEIASGLDLQLPIYLRAAEKLMAPAHGKGAGYCSLKRRERTAGLWKSSLAEETDISIRGAKSDLEWEKVLVDSETYIMEYVGSIRHGDFHLSTGDCSVYCPYQAVCRRDSVRGGVEDAVE